MNPPSPDQKDGEGMEVPEAAVEAMCAVFGREPYGHSRWIVERELQAALPHLEAALIEQIEGRLLGKEAVEAAVKRREPLINQYHHAAMMKAVVDARLDLRAALTAALHEAKGGGERG